MMSNVLLWLIRTYTYTVNTLLYKKSSVSQYVEAGVWLSFILHAWFRCRGGLWAHDAVNPLGVVRDDGVNSRLFQLTTLSSSVGCDAHHDAVVEQRTARVSLWDDRKTSRTGLNRK